MHRRHIAIGSAIALAGLAVAAGAYVEAPRAICLKTADAGPFVGHWRSAPGDDGTSLEVTVAQRGNDTFMKLGRCTASGPCDWTAPARATRCRFNPFVATAQNLRAEFPLGFATDSGVLSRAGSGPLALDIRRHWIIEDGGPRPDSFEHHVLVRA